MVSCCGPACVQTPAKSSVGDSHSPLEITPHKTRSVLNHLVRAMVALLYVRAKCGCAACTDISEDLALLRREHISPAFQELLTVLAKDIGDF